MTRKDYVATMARYNQWMNERLFESCAAMDDAERKRDRGAFFRSIHGTLNHLLLADRLWMGRFTGEPYRVSALDDAPWPVFDELRRERAITDAAILDWVAGLDEAALAADLHFTTIVDPGDHTAPLWRALTHFFNHQTHHRGQVTTLMMQAGVDPGVTDLMWMP